MTDTLAGLLVTVGAHSTAADAEKQSILSRAAPWEQYLTTDTDTLRVQRLATLLEGQALLDDASSSKTVFSDAFSCWQLLAGSSIPAVLEIDGDAVNSRLSVALRSAVAGLASDRVSEARHLLKRPNLLPAAADLRGILQTSAGTSTWKRYVLDHVAAAIALLVRKDGGWADVQLAIELMNDLRQAQSSMEAEHLSELEPDLAPREAIDLIACYHLAQMVTSTGEFLQTGDRGTQATIARLGRHRDQALDAAAAVHDGTVSRLARLLGVICVKLVQSSVWSQVAQLGTNVSQFVQELTKPEARNPLIELWPSQQEALQKNLLSPYMRAILVEMPTSAGKTLLAKFSILQTLALNPESTVAYVVPTRVLVNQVVDELRSDFRGLDYHVEQAIPVFELDPTEDVLLSQPTNVLVTTPEKLDLLIRDNHPSLQRLSMVVVDEAHNLADSARGARLELLLATLRRDRPGARYLLLSPFLPNAGEVVKWLGDDRALDPISVDWRPNKRIVGSIEPKRIKRGRNDIVLRTVDAANSDIAGGEELHLAVGGNMPTALKTLSLAAAKRFHDRGGVTLIVCRGKVDAVNRASDIAAERADVEATPLLTLTIAHLTDELGTDNTLAQLLRKGVGYHHAGMSLETRRLVEHLVSEGTLHTVCGTTTLSQGVNFPINNVIIETRSVGDRTKKMTYNEFWNTAGRAGRGAFSDLGVIAFPVLEDRQRKEWEKLFRSEAEKVVSQLASLISAADDISGKLNLLALREHEELSPFLQYLAHAMRVSGAAAAAEDVEDLLRSSLVYRQALDESEHYAAALVRLCRAYLQRISGDPGLVAVADGTGFSTPSVGLLRHETNSRPSYKDKSTWAPDRLFGPDTEPLADRIRLISELPEAHLGTDEHGEFNADTIAAIVRDWVNGRSVSDMAAEYWPEKQVNFTQYLYSKVSGTVSWGMGALQRVSWSGLEPSTIADDSAHIPSMIFYGVGSREAVWMRMVGLTRETAERAGRLWRARRAGTAPESYRDLREFVGNLTPGDWDAVRGSSALTGEQVHQLWRELT